MKLFDCFKSNNNSDDNIDNYVGAGCIFTNNKLILSGYQPYKKNPFISGIGGKKLENETYKKTALRELIEELFNISNISNTIIDRLLLINPIKIQYFNKYVNCIYNFNQLTHILDILNYYNTKSNLYLIFPRNIEDLIFNRNIKNGEISHLCLLPVINKKIIIDIEFNNDINLLSESFAT